MSAGTAPSLHDAQRAARAVAHLDAGIVLLYGSVAMANATEDSDIDLCLVFDDLGDYSQRQSLKNTAHRTPWSRPLQPCLHNNPLDPRVATAAGN